MTPCYTLKIATDFAAAHALRNYAGECNRLHGHNWKVEVEVRTSILDIAGMGIDFKIIKNAAKSLANDLDHRNLNELEPFDKINPTAENIAAYFFRGLTNTLNNDRVSVSAVTIWETERACVRYTED
jgi:6-pyruvoyltetrahydropterin/6-carboxytetrahydropterin synthase